MTKNDPQGLTCQTQHNQNPDTVDFVISNSKGLTETLRDICTSIYQSWESEENNKLNNHI